MRRTRSGPAGAKPSDVNAASTDLAMPGSDWTSRTACEAMHWGVSSSRLARGLAASGAGGAGLQLEVVLQLRDQFLAVF